MRQIKQGFREEEKMNVAVNTPSFNGNEKKYLMDCIETGWI